MISTLRIALPAAALAACFGMTSATPNEAGAQASRFIYIYNNCRRPIQLFVHHADQYRNWHPHGWYHYRPYEGTYIEANGVRLSQLEDHDLYIYAETTDNQATGRWQGTSDDPYVRFDGGGYRVRRMNYTVDNNGDYSVRMSCNNN